MKENLTVVLEQLKTARIQLGRRTLRKQVNLFEFDDSHEIEFNGHHSTTSLENHLYGLYAPVKQLADDLLQSPSNVPQELQKDFDMASFEVKEFRQRYFPKDNVDVLLHRVELPVTGDITNTCLPINVEFVFGNTNFETDTCILTLNSLQAPLSCSDFIPLGIHADQFNTLINISMAGTGNSFISNPLISIVTDCVGDTIATGFINSSGQLGLSVQGYPITPLANTVCYPITVQFSYGNTNFEIDTCFLTMDAITGIPESFNVESEISIFPNPSSNEITIQSKKSIHGNSYFIYDYQGNLILIGKLISENTFVDISKLSNGMYFLKIDNYLGEIYKVLKQ